MAIDNVLSSEEGPDRVLTFEEFTGRDTPSGLPPPYWYYLTHFNEKGIQGVFQNTIKNREYFREFLKNDHGLYFELCKVVKDPRKAEDPFDTIKHDLYRAYELMRDYGASNEDLMVGVDGR